MVALSASSDRIAKSPSWPGATVEGAANRSIPNSPSEIPTTTSDGSGRMGPLYTAADADASSEEEASTVLNMYGLVLLVDLDVGVVAQAVTTIGFQAIRARNTALVRVVFVILIQKYAARLMFVYFRFVATL
jgi:hypothetical protein